MAAWSEISIGEVDLFDRFDAEYFQPTFLSIATALEGRGVKLREISKLSCSAFYPPAVELYESGDVPFVRCVDVISYPIITEGQPFEKVPQDFVDENKNIRVVKTGDIIITKVGTPCFAGIIDSSLGYAALTRTVLGVTDIKREVIDPYYLLAFLRSDYGFYQLMREREQQIQLQLTLDRVGRTNVFLPRMEEQQEVADIIKEYQTQARKAKALYAEAENLLLHELGLDTLDLSHELTYERNFSEVAAAGRYDAQFFQPKYQKVIDALAKHWTIEAIGSWGKVLKGQSVSEYIENGVPVVRSGDLTDIDNTASFRHASASEDLFYLKPGDICISSIGFGSIGKVQVFDEEQSYATVSEVTVVRQSRVNPYYLQIFLQSSAGQLQIEKWITGATGQLHLYPRDVEKIVVPILPEARQLQFEEIVNKARRIKQEAKQLLEDAKRRVEQIVLSRSENIL